jgi:hypothetical protein
VDDTVAIALVAGPVGLRGVPHPEDLALAADDLDFAGWRLSSRPFSGMQMESAALVPAAERRATPPPMEEPGLGAPHCGKHRWWLAGLAGTMSTLLFSLLLLTLTSRESMNAKDELFSKLPPRIAGSAPDTAVTRPSSESRLPDPQLTAASPWHLALPDSDDGGQ